MFMKIKEAIIRNCTYSREKGLNELSEGVVVRGWASYTVERPTQLLSDYHAQE